MIDATKEVQIVYTPRLANYCKETQSKKEVDGTCIYYIPIYVGSFWWSKERVNSKYIVMNRNILSSFQHLNSLLIQHTYHKQ